jgi:signal transduction histidine kinase
MSVNLLAIYAFLLSGHDRLFAPRLELEELMWAGVEAVGCALIGQSCETGQPTKRSEDTEQTTRALRRQQALFAAAIHELRNPLNALLGIIELISRATCGLNNDLIKSAHTCGSVILQQIANFLDYSKLEFGDLQLSLKRDNLREQVHGLVTIFQPLAEKKELRLNAIINEGVPQSLEYDPGRLGQIVNNLVGNSLKFTHQGGVTVSVDWLPVVGDNEEQLKSLLEQATKKSKRDDAADVGVGIWSLKSRGRDCE